MTDHLQASKERSRRLYVEIFGYGHFDVADELLAADVINHGPGVPATVGTEGIKRQAALLRTAFPDLRLRLNDQFGEGDRVVSRWNGSGTHSGLLTLPGISLEPTGTPISFDEMRIDRHDGDRIVESWFLPDRYTLWHQLGLL